MILIRNKKFYFLLSTFYFLLLFSSKADASTNISATTTAHWAWNDYIGWIDFYNTNTVNVTGTATTTGYASSSAGYISLDCATAPSGSVCGQSNYGVVNDSVGNLTGWAWNDAYGWISFDCHNNNGCDTSNYEAYVDANGDFQNYAWNDVIGWISFNCANTGTCGTSTYKVNTSWKPTSTTGYLDSSTYDTGASSGAQLNSFVWYGALPTSTAVKFQFAVSNSSSGPWTFQGTDGTSNTYYSSAGPGSYLKLDYSNFNNFRYFRYRVQLWSDGANQNTPQVNDVIVSWSP